MKRETGVPFQMADKEQTRWRNGRLMDAVRILGGVDGQTSPNGNPVPLPQKKEKECRAEILKLVSNFQFHSREMGKAPRIKKVIENLDELVARASSLAALFGSLDEWTLKVLHEPLGPTGTLQLEGLASEALAPNHPERGLDGLRIWATDLKTLSEGARIASKSLTESLTDLGGQTNLGIQSMGTGRTFLVLNCVGLLREQGQDLSFSVGGNVERLAHAILEFASGGDEMPVPTAAVRKIGKTEPGTRKQEASVCIELNNLNRISCEDLEHWPHDTPMAIPPPPSPQEVEKLMMMAQALTRRQLGAFD